MTRSSQDQVFADSPKECMGLLKENVFPPSPIYDKDDQATRVQKRQQGFDYYRAAKRRKEWSDDVSSSDIEEAESYKVSAVLSTLIPEIVRSITSDPQDGTQEQVLVKAPIQCAFLLDDFVLAPPPIYEADNQAVRLHKLKQAFCYHRAVQDARLQSNDVSLKDMDEAEAFKIGAVIAVNMPELSAAIVINRRLEQVRAIQRMADTMGAINRNLSRCGVIQRNAPCIDDAHAVVPPTNAADAPLLSTFPGRPARPHRGLLRPSSQRRPARA
jgi:hypothetical protein